MRSKLPGNVLHFLRGEVCGKRSRRRDGNLHYCGTLSYQTKIVFFPIFSRFQWRRGCHIEIWTIFLCCELSNVIEWWMANEHSHRYEWTFRFIHILCSWKSHNVKWNDGNSRSSLLDVRIASRAPHLLRQHGNTIVFFVFGVAVTMLLLLNGDPMQLAAFLCHANCEKCVCAPLARSGLCVCMCVSARPCTFIVSQVIKQFNIFPLSIRYTHFLSSLFPFVVSCIVDASVAGCCTTLHKTYDECYARIRLRRVMIAASVRPSPFVAA